MQFEWVERGPLQLWTICREKKSSGQLNYPPGNLLPTGSVDITVSNLNGEIGQFESGFYSDFAP